MSHMIAFSLLLKFHQKTCFVLCLAHMEKTAGSNCSISIVQGLLYTQTFCVGSSSFLGGFFGLPDPVVGLVSLHSNPTILLLCKGIISPYTMVLLYGKHGGKKSSYEIQCAKIVYLHPTNRFMKTGWAENSKL